jgi:ankyrin repeat protein
MNKNKLTIFYWVNWSILLILLLYDINHMIYNGPIQYYVGKGNIEEVKKYISRGGDVNLKLLNEYSLLMVSIENRRYEITQYLLCNGADPNAINVRGETPIYKAIEYGDIKSISLLLQHQANVKINNNSQNMSPLSLAITMGNIDIVKLLVSNGAKVTKYHLELDTNEKIKELLTEHLNK